MVILGISCYYHESAAAIIVDGRVIAASAQERFSRIKHDEEFPTDAIDFCLKEANISRNRIDYVVFYEKPFRKFERNLLMSLRYFPSSRSFFVESMGNMLTKKLWIKSKIASYIELSPDKILFVPHHLSHAAAGYYPSGIEHAAILTLDGVGEWTTGMMGVAHGKKITPISELRYPHSVGLLYSAFTALLGFSVNDGEYKVMGMAGYGKPAYVRDIKKVFKQHGDGSIELNEEYFSFQRSTHAMYTQKFEKLFQKCDRFDLAASIQRVTEDIVIRMATEVYQKTKERNLIFGGGVALNSVINGLILSRTPFQRIFVYPAAGDDGGAVGAALYVYHHVLGYKKRHAIQNMYLGKGYTTNEIKTFLHDNNIPYVTLKPSKFYSYIVDALLRGNVVGWFDGRAEFGPRALGHRSILADPKRANMKDIVNTKIKFREEFRPFAPVVLSEYSSMYFKESSHELLPYMLATVQAKTKTKRIAAATVHVDGTARIQKLYPSRDRYRILLEEFYKQTKRPILLNTSFNLKGEPIVNSPGDAYSTFIRSGIDILVLGPYIIQKKDNV